MKNWLLRIRAIYRSMRVRQWALVVFAAFVVVNILLFAVFRNRTYPRTSIGSNSIGSISFGALSGAIDQLQLLPDEVALTHKDKTTKLPTAKLGVSVDKDRMVVATKRNRSWLPVANLLQARKVPVQLRVEEQVFKSAFASLATTYKQDPVNARIALNNGTFELKPETEGYKLNEQAVKSAIVDQLSRGNGAISLPAESITPAVKKESLQASLVLLQKQQQTSITLRYQSKNKKLSSQEIATLYVPSNGSYVTSSTQIRAKINSIAASFGITAQNDSEAANAVKNALDKNEALDFALVPVPISKTFTYCAQLRGVDDSHRASMESKLKAVFADIRGWNLGGRVAYTQVASGCNFTVWLSAANQMPSFGAICDASWSCAVGSNVVINFDRWQGASTAWNASGGSLDDYRSMVINHETGHWLGFGHSNCPGAGQSAPVMQQQSINLQGCKFNPWPTASELATLRGWLKI